jgi:hypothetical protein
MEIKWTKPILFFKNINLSYAHTEREPDYDKQGKARWLLNEVIQSSEWYSARYLAATLMGTKLSTRKIHAWFGDLAGRMGANELAAQVDFHTLRRLRSTSEEPDYIPGSPETNSNHRRAFEIAGAALLALGLGYAAKRYNTR